MLTCRCGNRLPRGRMVWCSDSCRTAHARDDRRSLGWYATLSPPKPVLEPRTPRARVRPLPGYRRATRAQKLTLVLQRFRALSLCRCPGCGFQMLEHELGRHMAERCPARSGAREAKP